MAHTLYIKERSSCKQKRVGEVRKVSRVEANRYAAQALIDLENMIARHYHVKDLTKRVKRRCRTSMGLWPMIWANNSSTSPTSGLMLASYFRKDDE